MSLQTLQQASSNGSDSILFGASTVATQEFKAVAESLNVQEWARQLKVLPLKTTQNYKNNNLQCILSLLHKCYA